MNISRWWTAIVAVCAGVLITAGVRIPLDTDAAPTVPGSVRTAAIEDLPLIGNPKNHNQVQTGSTAGSGFVSHPQHNQVLL